MDKPQPAYRGDEPYVFVCYAHADEKVVYPELRWLQDQGVRIWYDEGISAGRVWRAEIGEAIEGADKVLFYISAASLKSDHCNREISVALDEEKAILPVYLQDTPLTPDLKVGLARLQAIHRTEDDDYRRHLLEALGQTTPIDSDPPPANQSRPQSKYAVRVEKPMIAVLPFDNLSGDIEQEYFSDGISEDILNELAKSAEFAVRPRSSSFSLRGEAHDIQTIGRRLKVTQVLDGSVRRSGDRVRVTVQLSEVSTDTTIWSERYDRDLTDIFEVQDEIARAIANAVNAKIGGAPTREFVSSTAYTAFLRGRHYRQRGEIEAAEEWLKTAVELHPRNADAWYELAAIQIGRHGLGLVAKGARLEYLNKVLAIDPAHPGALADRAYQETHLVQHDYQRAINELVRLIRAHPNHEAPLSWLSMVLLGVGRDDLVLRLSSRLLELSPLSYGSGNLMMVALLSNDLERAKSALATFTQAGEVNPYYEIQIAMAERDTDKLDAIGGGAFFSAIATTRAMYLRGEFDALRQVTQSWQDRSGYQPFYTPWITSLLERDLDSAFEHYRAALVAGEPHATQWVRGLIGDRVLFHEFYADPRYVQMLEEFGLDSESTSKIVVPELPF